MENQWKIRGEWKIREVDGIRQTIRWSYIESKWAATSQRIGSTPSHTYIYKLVYDEAIEWCDQQLEENSAEDQKDYTYKELL